MKVASAIIGPTHGTGHGPVAQVEEALAKLGLQPDRKLSYYPPQAELARLLRAADPDVLFISTDIPAQMEETVTSAFETLPDLEIVLIDSASDHDVLRRAMRLGVRECVSAPFDFDDVRGAMERSMKRRLARGASASANSLYSFLPAKPGVGATTLAIQTALHLQLDAGNRALLCDADLEAGMIRFILRLSNPHSLLDALDHADRLDEHFWPQLVSEIGNLDVIQAGDTAAEHRIDLARLQSIVSFARRQYAVMIADLPGAITRLSVELIQQSKCVFIVSTPEIASLHMARVRIRQLQDLGLGPQLRLLINRVEKKSPVRVEEVVSAVG